MRSTIIFLTLLVAASTALLGCGKQAAGDAELNKDKADATELGRLNALLATNRPVTRMDLDSLIRIREKYPNSSVARQLLQGAFVKRGDWASAEKVITDVPEEQRSNADRLNLAKLYLKQGHFSAARDLLKAVPASGDDRVETLALLGQAQFYSGEPEAAASSLESVQVELVTQKRSDDLAILGTIYLRLGDHKKAIEVLEKVIETSPNNITAHSTLSRAYAAAGDAAKAEIYREKLQAINDQVAADEKKKTRLVTLFYNLENAFEAKDYDRVIALVNQIKPEADSVTLPTLYQYLAAAYRGQGKEAEARDALAEAARSIQK